jgi:hypothetical protein
MKKKSLNENARRRKLVLPREAIAVLTPPQLGQVAGGEAEGGSYWPPCSHSDLEI